MSAHFEWPPISEPKLIDRLELDDAGFTLFFEKIAGLIGPREFSDQAFAHALAYPWERPEESYLLSGESTTLLAGLSAHERTELVTGRSAGGAPGHARFPLLAFGSNAAPHKLGAKLEHLSPDHRQAFVVSGELHGFDVGVSAHAAIYGALPATIFPSPGTAVRAAVIWATAEQLAALAWTEISYLLGRLDDIEFAPDFAAEPIRSAFVFVSRLGAHRIGDEIVAMDAVEAVGRSAPAFTQHELLDQLAPRVFGTGAGAEQVVRAVFEDYAGASRLIRESLRPQAVRFASANWTRFGR